MKRKIRFCTNKNLELIENGTNFLNTIKKMLLNFNINTTKTWNIKSNKRKDGNITRKICFNILTQDIPTFKKEIGFRIIHKKNLLEGASGVGQA